MSKPAADPPDNGEEIYDILLVDDQPIIAEAIKRMLVTEPDMRFHYCQASDRALQLAHEIQPTVILQDLVMPDTDGMQLLAAYRNDAALSEVPVVILSTKEDPHDKSAAFAAGASDYLVKIPDRIELIARIRAHSRSYLSQKQRDELLQEIKIVHEQLKAVYAQLHQSHQELEKLSCMDGLTGISNRRHFDTYFSQEWLRALREKISTSLILVDIDYFKLYNDHYGHQAGDLCLQAIAQALADTLQRPGDLAARYGGEEFVVLLPYTDAKGAENIAKQLLDTVKKLAVAHAQSPIDAHVTISLGVATLTPDSSVAPSDLVQIADTALYQAKEQGRNRYVLADISLLPKAPRPKAKVKTRKPR